MTNDFLYSSNSKLYEKQPWYNETSLKRANVASPLAIPHYGFLSVELGFRIPILSAITNSLSCIPSTSTSNNLLNSRTCIPLHGAKSLSMC